MGSSKNRSGSSKRDLDRNSNEYRQKRQKNNDAVKRSRDKSKQKAVESQTKVQRLQMENNNLRDTLNNMQQELKFLKEMLVSQAGNSNTLTPELEKDLKELLQEEGPSQNPQKVAFLVQRVQEMQQQQQLQMQQQAQNIDDGIDYGNPSFSYLSHQYQQL